MSTILIIILLAVLILAVAALAAGRGTYEVESARDTEYLELEGAWVRYNIVGGGPPVVLVHGWLSSSAVWDELAQRLSQRFTVYTLDLTGFGESDKPLDGYGVRYGSRLLYAFCAHFGLTRVNIIGHDLGGDMVIKLASDHPDVVGRIVLVATPANEEQVDLPTLLWLATLPVVGPLFYLLGRSVRAVRSNWMSAFVSEPEDVTEEMLDAAASSTPAAMRKTFTVSKREIAGGRLARQARIVKVPTLIVAGEEDQVVDPQAAGVWARSLDRAEVCLMDECGHMPMIERAAEFNAQVLAFLTGDARYLEYAEQQRLSPPEGATEEDTIEVGTLPAEGEDPAFASGPETAEIPANERPDADRDREEPEIPVARRRSRSGGRAGDQGSFLDRLPFVGREERSRSGEREEPLSGTGPDEEEEPSGEHPDRPVKRKRNPVSWNFDEVEPEQESTAPGSEAAGEDRPKVRRRSRYDGLFDKEESPGESGRDEQTSSPPGERSRDYTAEPDELTDRADPVDEPRPRSEPLPRRRRRSFGGGGVPEVPDDLFDWGSSLDDFEPVRRERRERGPLGRGPLDQEGAGDEGRRETSRREPREGEPEDEGPFGGR
ncbi:Alpha/beta hydrolase family [Rubrobacter radiotolerans]|uniref:Alpha/beta hydrolase n=1 Tax=Rubrobacter radiotolerans TaxID=42256 RepID=A0A023X2U9_RUBRA|nr:alpha/beta hydrolase [Rubrobacter radiotolerans]AHY46389.1 Alpha/beta hydrolase family [Rubrobacter radiotolerans]MDX5893796.1 alpha/beta hydrolase [Rubrobacter radiotolerans]SMC04517.1 Pimeloyl-ACP methyl ester carboxylesterase [Rubrobacter radiotolerans DSM 5868]